MSDKETAPPAGTGDGEGLEMTGEVRQRAEAGPRKKRTGPAQDPGMKPEKSETDKPSDIERLLSVFSIFRKHKRKTIFFTVVLLLGYIIWWGIQPQTGSIRYGICKVFAKSMLRYPETMQPVTLYESGGTVSMDYNYRDPFGNFKSERLDCKFGKGQNGQLVMSSAVIIREKREPVDDEVVAKFSQTIPAVIEGGLDFVAPYSPGESLKSLKVD